MARHENSSDFYRLEHVLSSPKTMFESKALKGGRPLRNRLGKNIEKELCGSSRKRVLGNAHKGLHGETLSAGLVDLVNTISVHVTRVFLSIPILDLDLVGTLIRILDDIGSPGLDLPGDVHPDRFALLVAVALVLP